MTLYNTDLVQPNKYSRPQIPLVQVKGIVNHWTANPGGTDTGHQTFFDGEDGGGSRYAGAHFFVDKDSAVLIIPLNEVAYHANEKTCRVPKLGTNANLCTIGIEMCVEKDGTIHPDTVKRTAELNAHLLSFYKLTTDDIYRHYDVTGKNCPRPWVEQPILFDNFKKDVHAILNPVKEVPKVNTDKITLHYTALWQTRKLVDEYKAKGFKAYGWRVTDLGKDVLPQETDAYKFVIETDFKSAGAIKLELESRGYKVEWTAL
jgi:N-acetylmuramoyl-L-alanine amidase CwlA